MIDIQFYLIFLLNYKHYKNYGYIIVRKTIQKNCKRKASLRKT